MFVEVEKQANNFHIIVNCNHNIIHPGWRVYSFLVIIIMEKKGSLLIRFETGDSRQTVRKSFMEKKYILINCIMTKCEYDVW